MKKLIILMLLSITTKAMSYPIDANVSVGNKKYDINCSLVKGSSWVSFKPADKRLGQLYRCENDEIVCYITPAGKEGADSIFCKFKN